MHPPCDNAPEGFSLALGGHGLGGRRGELGAGVHHARLGVHAGQRQRGCQRRGRALPRLRRAALLVRAARARLLHTRRPSFQGQKLQHQHMQHYCQMTCFAGHRSKGFRGTVYMR